VENLKDENSKLEEKVKLLTKELDFLKNIFKTHTSKQRTNKWKSWPIQWIAVETFQVLTMGRLKRSVYKDYSKIMAKTQIALEC